MATVVGLSVCPALLYSCCSEHHINYTWREGGGEWGKSFNPHENDKSRTMVKLNIENLHKDAVDCLGLGNMNDEIV